MGQTSFFDPSLLNYQYNSNKPFHISFIPFDKIFIVPIQTKEEVKEDYLKKIIYNQALEHLALDMSKNYEMRFIRYSNISFVVFLIEKEILKQFYKPLIRQIHYLDLLLPEPCIFSLLYENKFLPLNNDIFIVFKENYAFLSLYIQGVYAESKSLKSYQDIHSIEQLLLFLKNKYQLETFNNIYLEQQKPILEISNIDNILIKNIDLSLFDDMQNYYKSDRLNFNIFHKEKKFYTFYIYQLLFFNLGLFIIFLAFSFYLDAKIINTKKELSKRKHIQNKQQKIFLKKNKKIDLIKKELEKQKLKTQNLIENINTIAKLKKNDNISLFSNFFHLTQKLNKNNISITYLKYENNKINIKINGQTLLHINIFLESLEKTYTIKYNTISYEQNLNAYTSIIEINLPCLKH